MAGRYDRPRVAAVRFFHVVACPTRWFSKAFCVADAILALSTSSRASNRAADQRADQCPAGESHFVTAPLAEFRAYHRAGGAPDGGPGI